MNKAKNMQAIKIAVFITSIFVIFLSVTYAFVNMTLTGTKKQVITAGNLELVLEEDENNLTIENALPMYDEVGMIQEAFTFRLVNKTANATNYILKLVDITTGDKLLTSDVKYGLTKDGENTIALLSSLIDGVIDSGTIAGNATQNYALHLWIRDGVTDNSTITGKSLSYRIDVEVSQEFICVNEEMIKDTSNANLPILVSGMIPVIYDECERVWKKADTTGIWYNYDTQNWANAVTVTQSSRADYISASAGTAISMDDINTMWVWIPRYEYQYTDLGDQYAGGTQDLPGEIKINFISKTQISPSDSNIYKIPEGFTFGEEELSGFWMAKFETSGSISEECTSEDCTTADLTVKPNLNSIVNRRIASYFYASRSMQNMANAQKYGFDVIGTGTMDTHMVKNTEWGIVAYLSQSKYGKYGNPNYTGANKEVYQNKSDSFITGMSNGTPSTDIINTQVPYDTPFTGYGASTTGTIYGVYDMSGGNYEFVMGNYNNTLRNDGFTTFPESKYYDLYTSTIASTAYKAGDAIYETIGWYSDYSLIVNSAGPWFGRGGLYASATTYAGVFYYNSSIGIGSDSGFRLAIAP